MALGGLHIIGTERHESRRIDNQLRGRAGRQGDPGSSRFYVSLEDDLMRLFGSERIAGIMERLGWEDDQPIEHNQITRAIENAQKQVEARNFEIRKQVLQYDDVHEQAAGGHLRPAPRRCCMGENLREQRRGDDGAGWSSDCVDTYCDEKAVPRGVGPGRRWWSACADLLGRPAG